MKVALYQPEIPGNTGNVIRLCANTGTALHLVEPLGFEWDDARLKRAGLDYHEYASVVRHPDADAILSGQLGPVLGFSTHAVRSFYERPLSGDEVCLFGPETRGRPESIRSRLGPDRLVRLPMQPSSRSLNLSNSVAVAVYEAWRQQAFRGAR